MANRIQSYEISHFPNVIGCIDCTHIKIKNPFGEIGEVYRNRKGWMSINTPVVVGPSAEILDIDVHHPGSTHDNTIFDRSSLWARFENNELNRILLGDNGYACRSYLLTPFIETNSDPERRYNR
ncbi:unnamed protein product [Acanthoscelides obtectus]|uniref:DDE Tnp4 domain-containing protein n=1 Tax=Acanthoscelides obtectus TaxID=200917 RepID=A0A9P0LN70_ACAOB|nr:unnamed protein product [Acanthoscelides obtectus]CAK1640633.1 Putative nuclease HARBI1 [Acanthoscelides obtectus]